MTFDVEYPTRTCIACGDVCDEYDMFGNFCEDCFRQAITYDSFLRFSEDTADKYSLFRPDAVQRFMFDCIFGIENMTDSTPALRKEMRELYLRKVAHEKLVGGEVLLTMLRNHVCGDMLVRDEFAEWLTVEEVVRNGVPNQTV